MEMYGQPKCEHAVGIHLYGGVVNSRAGLDIVKKRTIDWPYELTFKIVQ
jgi:hypothetical protein